MPLEKYLFRDANGPFFKMFRHEARERASRITIGIIDDGLDIIQSLQRMLGTYGYDTLGFHINSDRSLMGGQLNTAALEIAGHGIGLAICDKGIGQTSGIDLILALKEEGIPTVMLTGEPNTRETHKVADRYLEKPVFAEELLPVIKELALY